MLKFLLLKVKTVVVAVVEVVVWKIIITIDGADMLVVSRFVLCSTNVT